MPAPAPNGAALGGWAGLGLAAAGEAGFFAAGWLTCMVEKLGVGVTSKDSWGWLRGMHVLAVDGPTAMMFIVWSGWIWYAIATLPSLDR